MASSRGRYVANSVVKSCMRVFWLRWQQRLPTQSMEELLNVMDNQFKINDKKPTIVHEKSPMVSYGFGAVMPVSRNSCMILIYLILHLF